MLKSGTFETRPVQSKFRCMQLGIHGAGDRVCFARCEMVQKILLPKLDESMQEATLVAWHVKVGDVVRPGQLLYEIDTEKACVEIESEVSGTVRHLLFGEGDVVPAMGILAILAEEGEEVPLEMLQPPVPAETAPSVASSTAPGSAGEASPAAKTERKTISPRAKALAKKLGVPLEAVEGTGPGGRITENDVRQYHDRPTQSEEPQPEGATIEPLTPMRAAIARRLSSSKQTAPHFYLTEVVDMSATVEFRKKLRGDGVEIGFTDMVLRATGLALRELPQVAWLFTPEGYLVRDHMNVGLAVVEDEGIVVPVVRDADRKGLAEVAAAARELVLKARSKKLAPADCTGGVFTVSNLGMHGVEEFAAIINPGESAILAVGSIRKAPAVVEDRVEVRPLMRITLSSDHRVIDGVLAARFVGRLRALLENPQSLL